MAYNPYAPQDEEEDFLLQEDTAALAEDDSSFLLSEDGDALVSDDSSFLLGGGHVQTAKPAPASYTSDIRFSKEHFKERQGRGGLETAKTLEQFSGFKLPETVSNTLKDLQEEGELGTAGYIPDYPGYVTENPVLPWAGEQVGQQSYENVILYGGGLLAQIFKKANIPVLVGTSVVTFNSIHDEALNELAELNNKTVDELTDKEREDAFYGALQNTALELFNPFFNMKLPGIKGKGKTLTDKVEDFVNTAKKEGFGKVLKNWGKASVKLGLGEAATETIETANIMRLSEPGIGYATTEEGKDKLASSMVGGYAGGKTFGQPAAIREARSHNKLIKEGTEYLKQVNQSNLLTAGEQYQQEVNRGPVLPTFDVTPKQYKVPEQPKTFMENLGGYASDKLLKRSTNIFEDMLKRAETGKDVYTIHNELFSMFGDVETGSGLSQTKPSFNTLKHTKLGEYATEFADIYQKWSSSVPLAGEMLGKVHPLIDAYVGAKLENKNVSEALADLKGVLSKKQIRDLDNDINSLRGVYNKVHKDLKEILGESALKFGFTKNYLTRGINRQAIENNKQEFLDSLVNDVKVYPKGMDEDKVTLEDRYREAERIYNDILNGKDPAVMSSEQIRKTKTRKGETRKGFEKHRDLRWDALNQKFRNQSSFESMQDYLGRAATRAASAQVFGGNRAEKLSRAVDQALKRGIMTNDEAQRVWDMYDAEHNVYKRPTNERERAAQQASRGIASVTAVSLLGLASISSITEPAWISGRVGIANMLKATPAVAGHTLKGIIRTLYGGGKGTQATKSFGRDVLNLMGMAINPKVNERVEMLFAGDVSPAMTAWFRSPGGLFLTQYTNFVRVWTAVAGLKMIQDQAKKVNKLKGKKLAALKRELKENGMSINDFKQLSRLNAGKIDIMNDEFLDTRIMKEDGTQSSVRDLIVPWMRKITTDVALEPHVGNRPLWMSNPELQLLAQLKSFPILFGNTIIKRTYRQIKPKACTPQIVGTMGALGSVATALALGSLAMAIKDAIRGVDEDRNVIDVIGSIGVPYITSPSAVQLVSVPATSIVDKWVTQPFKTDDGVLETTAENIVDLIVRATMGSIFAEQLED